MLNYLNTGTGAQVSPFKNSPELFTIQESPLEDSPELFANNEAAVGLNSPACSQNSDAWKPQLLTQAKLNDLVRDLGLSKQKAELLGSRLQEQNLLDPSTRISVFRNRSDQFAKFYKQQDSLCVCVDIDGLMKELGVKHVPSDWRLFIDSAKTSLKAVLLYNGNEKPSIPIAHTTTLKETYNSMKTILNAIQYDKFKWKICGDLKVVGLLLGMQSGYTKYMCYLCLWDSRAYAEHYTRKDWPERTQWTANKENVKYESLVPQENILLPPLHIKLGLMKNFVRGLDTKGRGFKYLQKIFPNLSDAKVKAGVFDGPQIRKVLKDKDFRTTLTKEELTAWLSFEAVVKHFLGN